MAVLYGGFWWRFLVAGLYGVFVRASPPGASYGGELRGSLPIQNRRPPELSIAKSTFASRTNYVYNVSQLEMYGLFL